MSDDERMTLLAEMRKDRAGQRALDALLEAFACRQVMRQAINSETRIVASMDMLDWSLAAMQEIGAFEEIKRQMVSHVNGRQVNTGTDSNTHKLLRPKHRRTEAGQRQIRAATERLLLIMEPYVIGSHAANATVAISSLLTPATMARSDQEMRLGVLSRPRRAKEWTQARVQISVSGYSPCPTLAIISDPKASRFQPTRSHWLSGHQ